MMREVRKRMVIELFVIAWILISSLIIAFNVYWNVRGAMKKKE